MNRAQRLYILRRRRRRGNRRGVAPFLLGMLALPFLLVALVGLVGLGTAAGIYAYYAQTLPDPTAIETEQERFETTKIYDRTGQHLLWEVFDPRWGRRTIVPLEQIPVHLRNATVAIEDKSFYRNPGIDLRGIARAAWRNLRGYPIEGASTITMQLVKNVLIPPEERYRKSYARKIKEAILALEISRRYSKDQILEWYLNNVYYGHLAYGVAAAAETYFGKPVQELDLAECAMLAALPQYPALNPFDNPEQARKRQHLVLDAMMRQGYITPEEAVAAKYKPLRYVPKRFEIKAPHFVMYVRQLLEDELGPEMLYRGGLKVYTTLDMDIQAIAEEAARKHVKKLREEGHDVTNAAVVVMRPQTGEILAMVGSLDYFDQEIHGQVNMALAKRQPGSAFKPFTYVTAFARGFTPATMVMDVRTAFPDPPNPPYVPENYTRKYYGPQRIRQALAKSLNIPAVKVLSAVGVKNVINTAHKMGINTLDKDYYGLSLTLGGGEVTLLDMTYAYGVFANGGVMAGQPVRDPRPGYRELDPVAILKVEDSQGQVIMEYTSPHTKEVLKPELAYLITDILSDNEARAPMFGYNSALKLSRPAAAKTGTTNDWRDTWTVGYTPQIVTGVWVGNADNRPMEHVTGLSGAAPIWHEVMERIYEEGIVERLVAPQPVQERFTRPPNLEEVEVCAVSGLLPTEYCPHRVKELFIKGTAPTSYCNVHQVFRVNKVTGKLATIYTPPELVEERVYEIFPPEAADWVRQNNIPQPPTEYDDAYGPSPASDEVAIISPSLYSYVRGVVPIIGNARSSDFRLYRLEFGEGLNPSAWSQIGPDHYHQVENGPLEYWDTTGLKGFYTLQLSVLEGSGRYKQAAIQVTVDNISPTITLIHPEDGAVYVMEDDEWVNIQAQAQDDFSMDRVEFYLDGQLLGYSTVPPYNWKWTIVMSDIIPVEGPPVLASRIITNPDGSLTMEVITVSQVLVSPDGHTLTQVFANGMTIISDTVGYTETHLIHAVAYDAAGNAMESEKVRIHVIHKPPKEESGAWQRPVAWRKEEERL